jgi:uncharacterized membrane protein HdeD (DUF308 family)
MAIAGAISLIFAVVLFTAPMMGAKIAIWWIGAWAILFGIAVVILGFTLRSAREKVKNALSPFREG